MIINTLPTKEGDVRIRTGWAGPGESDYNIHVIPQGNDELTKQYVIDRIVEYSYKGIFDTAGSDGNSVYFTNGNNDYETILNFTDAGGTGMSCSIETVSDAPWEIYYWYIGSDIEDVNWGNVKNGLYQAFQAHGNHLLKNCCEIFPKHIYLSSISRLYPKLPTITIMQRRAFMTSQDGILIRRIRKIKR